MSSLYPHTQAYIQACMQQGLPVLSSLVPGEASVYGVVTAINPPRKSKGSDYTCSFSITDPSKQNIDEFIKVNLFRRSLEDFNSPSVFGGGVGGDSAPRLPAVGDIVFCHKLTVTQFNSRSQLIGYSNVDWWSITLLTRAAASGGSTSSLASSTGAENIPPSANRPSSSSSGMLSTLKSSPAFNLIREWCNRVAFPTSSSAGQIGYGGYPSTSSSNVIQIQSLQGRSSFGSSSGDNKPVPKIMEIDKVVNRYIHFNGLIVSVWRDPAPPYPGKRGELYVAIADFTRLGEQAGVGGSSSSGRGYSLSKPYWDYYDPCSFKPNMILVAQIKENLSRPEEEVSPGLYVQLRNMKVNVNPGNNEISGVVLYDSKYANKKSIVVLDEDDEDYLELKRLERLWKLDSGPPTLVTYHPDSHHVFIKDILRHYQVPHKFKLRAWVVDHRPSNIKDFCVRVCNKCQASIILSTATACSSCRGSLVTSDSFKYEFRFMLMLFDGTGYLPLQFDANDAVIFFKNLAPANLWTDVGTLDALKDRLSRLWNVSATLQTANVPTCPFQGAKVFEVIVESFTGRVGAGGGGTGRGAAPHQPIVANNNRNQTANHLLGKPIIRYRAINTQINSLEDE